MPKINDGGSAFPLPMVYHSGRGVVIDAEEYSTDNVGMSLRAWLCGSMHLETDLLERVSQCDDADLLDRFGTEEECAEGFTLCFPGARDLEHYVSGKPKFGGDVPFKNIELRQKLEARARAALRLIEADAMLKALENSNVE